MKKERILLKVFRSRKSFLLYYLLIIAIITALIYIQYTKNSIEYKILIAGVIIVLLLIKSIELGRVRDWWAITDSTLIESKSILDKNVREIDFASIADIDLDQPLFKRILGYGTVNIRKFLNEKSIIIKDINCPEKFINILQDAIERKKENDRRKP